MVLVRVFLGVPVSLKRVSNSADAPEAAFQQEYSEFRQSH